MKQVKDVPIHQWWFDEDPQDPNLRTELILIERAIGDPHGPWRVDGALVKELGRDPRWVDGWTDDYWTADAKGLWDYLVDKGGGNLMSWEIGFLRIASPEDASKVAAYYHEQFSKGNPFGLTKPETVAPPLVHEVFEETEDPTASDPCREHFHVAMPFAAADPLTWRLAVELVRRHPEELWIIRTFPIDGFYDCLSIRRLPHPLLSSGSIAINRNGSHVNVGWFGNPDEASESEPLMSWGDFYAEPDPRTWLRTLEAIAGLSAPGGRLPPSTPSSLALRWVATFLSMQTGSRPRWTAWNDWNEVDSGQHPGSFDAIPGAWEWLRDQGGGTAAARVLFVGTYEAASRMPVFALSSEGHLWIRDGSAINVSEAYRKADSSLARLVVRTAVSVIP